MTNKAKAGILGSIVAVSAGSYALLTVPLSAPVASSWQVAPPEAVQGQSGQTPTIGSPLPLLALPEARTGKPGLAIRESKNAIETILTQSCGPQTMQVCIPKPDWIPQDAQFVGVSTNMLHFRRKNGTAWETWAIPAPTPGPLPK